MSTILVVVCSSHGILIGIYLPAFAILWKLRNISNLTASYHSDGYGINYSSQYMPMYSWCLARYGKLKGTGSWGSIDQSSNVMLMRFHEKLDEQIFPHVKIFRYKSLVHDSRICIYLSTAYYFVY